MRLRIDLRILVFLIIFYFTNQLNSYLIIMFFSILHEMGHIIIGIFFKMKIEKLEFMPFGLSVSFCLNFNDDKLYIKEIFIALAGPITSLLLAIVFKNIKIIYYSNILILLFNLMPIYPLDGARIIKGILHIKKGTVESENIISKISYITIIIFTLASSIAVYYYKNIAIFLVCIFLWNLTLQEKRIKCLLFYKENSKM